MPVQIEVQHLSFTAWETKENLLQDVSLSVHQGERIGLVGASGSGKTTLTYFLAGVQRMALAGKTEGRIFYNGISADDFFENPEPDFRVGMALQNPDSQIFSATVYEEIGYGLPEDALFDKKLNAALEQVGLEKLKHAPIRSLSLGQKQRVVIASFLVHEPDFFILDEPTNSLDAPATDALFEVLDHLKSTILIIEHDVERLCDWAQRMVEMEAGKIVAEGSPERWLQETRRLPKLYRIGAALARPEHRESIFVRPSKLLHFSPECSRENNFQTQSTAQKPESEPLLRLETVHCGYKKDQPVLSDISFSVRKNERLAILGHNACGKTTLLKHLAGILQPISGDIFLNNRKMNHEPPEKRFGQVGFVFQNPDYQLFETTVERECGFCLRTQSASESEISEKTAFWLKRFGLASLNTRSPLSLSFGEKRRLTLASVLVSGAELIALDEPTTALDEENISILKKLLLDLSESSGKTLIFATHDVDFALDVATRILVIGNGGLLADFPVDEISNEDFHAMQISLPFSSRLAINSGFLDYPVGSQKILTALNQNQS
ncbi:ABC transporter-related protein [Chloroherpeton thalassium ATCC 35110]|uniref:ABC transporter-related protein n=1 Tax=Chloroherpeton thalassium (strain ATCC 35110 / GB-78) TaxID=517418 RepID=B3QUK1_CHLT3|nr:ABC transporter ATP-binding protein [Chloroherpeton thalassium]ACF12907.1 ABC transporter-related protein [Chloroherpeton thalassium ATCC 35110]